MRDVRKGQKVSVGHTERHARERSNESWRAPAICKPLDANGKSAKLGPVATKIGREIAVNGDRNSMKSNNNSKSDPKIKLSKTFFKIAAGELAASEVAANKKAQKEAAKEEAARKGKVLDRTDPFISNFER